MNQIPKKLKDEMGSDPYYHRCLRKSEGECRGRVTWEHVWIYSGRQVQEKWAIIPLCIYHHLGSGLNKKMNKWFSVNRMTPEDEQKYPRVNWKRERIVLNKLYGNPKHNK